MIAHVGDVVVVHVAHGAHPDVRPFTIVKREGDKLTLQCVDPACVPPLHLVRPGLPEITLAPRVTASEVARAAQSFRRDTAAPSPSYRVAPGAVRLVAVLAALLAATAGAALLRPRRTTSALERALALLRSSARRDAADRRRALDLAGRVTADDRLLSAAWAPPVPSSERVLELADEVAR